MRVITALDEGEFYSDNLEVFMAGGISGCPDWQKQYIGYIRDARNDARSAALCDLTLWNPRRPDFPIGDPNAAKTQIEWEWHKMAMADAVSFWFPCETPCPITLYELGKWTGFHGKPIFVGVHPDYSRKQDVLIQTQLERPEVEVVQSLHGLTAQVVKWVIEEGAKRQEQKKRDREYVREHNQGR